MNPFKRTKLCAWHIPDSEHLNYMTWHHRAHESHQKGERQYQCPGCKRWYFNWERTKTKKAS